MSQISSVSATSLATLGTIKISYIYITEKQNDAGKLNRIMKSFFSAVFNHISIHTHIYYENA